MRLCNYHMLNFSSDKASGFCYVNDVVLAALELLETFDKLLILDLDIHHGDGVEKAFYNTGSVYTVSLHRFDTGFYPGSGGLKDVGIAKVFRD